MRNRYLLLFCMQILQTFCSGTEMVNNVCKVDGTPSCSQECTNNKRGYSCSCYHGYVLADNNRTCIITGNEPIFVLLTGKTVDVYYTEAEEVETLTKLPDSHVTALGFGPDASLLIVAKHGKAVYRTKLNVEDERGEFDPFIDTGLRYVTSVTVDWVTSNIYLIDKDAGKIILCSWKGDNCAVLIKNLVRPYSIVVNLNSGKLLWSEWGQGNNAGSIVLSYLDGSQLKVIMNKLSRPQNLVFDRTSNVLYWLARFNDVTIIQSVNMFSGNRQVYGIEGADSSPSLSLLTDHLYLTMSNSTLMIDKFTGATEKVLATGSAIIASTYHPVLYESSPQHINPCVNSLCSHLCVPDNSNHGYLCLCPVGMYLETEENCTRKKGAESLFVAGMFGVYEVHTNFIGYHSYQSSRLLEAEANCLVYDKVGDKIYYHDDTWRELRMIRLDNPRKPRTLYTNAYMVEGMALDAVSGVIYWTVSQGSVYAGRVDGSFSTTLITDLSKPRGITVDPESGLLYICDWGRNAKILQCHMDGSHCTTFLHVHGGHPNMIAIGTPLSKVVAIETKEQLPKRRKTLYWTDSKLNQISYATLETNVENSEKIVLNYSLNSHPYGLVVTDSTIFFTDLNTKCVHYIEKWDVTEVVHLQLDVGLLFAVDHNQRFAHVSKTVCSVNNGGCTHLCLLKPEGQRSCLCPGRKWNESCKVTEENMVLQTNLSDILTKKKIKEDSVAKETKTEDSVLLWVLPLTGLFIILCTISILVICHYRNRKRRQGWMSQFIHYMKARQSDDSEGLVSDSNMSMSDPHFRQYEDIDYPEDNFCLRNLRDHNSRETSMISADSAFTEMRDFEMYSSIDND